MSGEPTLIRTAHGSYVQLNTFDDKENTADAKASVLSTRPYKRFLCTKRDTIIVTIVLVAAFILITTTLALGLPKLKEKKQRYYDTSFPESPSTIQEYEQAVVLSDGAPCAKIGKDILQEGGSAVDAAIAALFCNGVVNPQSMGLGGGFFMTVFIKQTNTSEVIDARVTAPQTSSKDMFHGNYSLSLEGGLSIAVPGELRGYSEAHKRYGKLSWKKLVEPSINLCNNGFEVSEHLANKLQSLKDKILADESLKEEFYNNETNSLYKEGDILKRPVLALTLKDIADNGPEIFYTGELKDKILKDLAECGSIINSDDLIGYEAKIQPAIRTFLSNPDKTILYTVPPPGSGLLLSFILNILQNYNMTSSDFSDIDQASLMYHRIIESFKHAFAHRTQLGDSGFVNVTELVAKLQSKEYAELIWKEISDKRTYPISHYNPESDPNNDHGTAHVSVLAANGDAVSVTSTINTYFGSLCRSPSTGIIFNNEMDNFASPNITSYFGLPPSPANYIMPGKRPISSMCPSVLTNNNNEVQMVIGSAGGTRMITATALSLIRMLWLSEDIKKATDAPRIHHQLYPNYVQYEHLFPKVYLDNLKEFGHSIQPDTQPSVFLGIVKENGKWKTNIDYRKGGSSDGY